MALRGFACMLPQASAAYTGTTGGVTNCTQMQCHVLFRDTCALSASCPPFVPSTSEAAESASALPPSIPCCSLLSISCSPFALYISRWFPRQPHDRLHRLLSHAVAPRAVPTVPALQQLQGVGNARDFAEACSRIAPGKLFRSANPMGATREDIVVLREQLGISELVRAAPSAVCRLLAFVPCSCQAGRCHVTVGLSAWF